MFEDDRRRDEDGDEEDDDGGSFFTFIFFLGLSGGKGEAVDVLCGGRFICICARVIMSWRVMPRVSRSTEFWGRMKMGEEWARVPDRMYFYSYI